MRTVGASTQAQPPGSSSCSVPSSNSIAIRPLWQEVELLLLLVEVAAGLVGGRDDDRVDAEGGHAEALADLAEAVALAEVGEVGDGVAVALARLARVCRSLPGSLVNNLSPPMTVSTSTQIPAELKPADGRFGCGPSKVRPEALARLAERADADGDLAPPEAGQGPGRPGPRRPRRALRACPTATRSRSATAARPPSGRPPPPGSCASAPLHLTYGEFSQKFAKATAARALPRRPDPGRGRARRRARAGRRPRRRRDRLGPQRDLDRRHGRRAAPRRAPATPSS